jgi:hypothetical protein
MACHPAAGTVLILGNRSELSWYTFEIKSLELRSSLKEMKKQIRYTIDQKAGVLCSLPCS